jgi:hypothetical protein
MKYCTVLMLLFAMLILNGFADGQQKTPEFKKASFYKILSDGKEVDLNQQLDVLKLSSFEGKEAFEGTLLMKKAGIIKGAKNKLNLFRAGHKKLEAVLQKDSLNVEFRFLRLIIQEHSPGILGYKSELDKDKNYIRENFKKLTAVVQQAVIDYSKTSRVLSLENY